MNRVSNIPILEAFFVSCKRDERRYGPICGARSAHPSHPSNWSHFYLNSHKGFLTAKVYPS